jgi:mono/diheme cytochrome c family protein
VFCHGADGTGGHGGPAFGAELTASEIQRMVANGSNTMPAFGMSLNYSDIANVSAWVIELVQRAGDEQRR